MRFRLRRCSSGPPFLLPVDGTAFSSTGHRSSRYLLCPKEVDVDSSGLSSCANGASTSGKIAFLCRGMFVAAESEYL